MNHALSSGSGGGTSPSTSKEPSEVAHVGFAAAGAPSAAGAGAVAGAGAEASAAASSKEAKPWPGSKRTDAELTQCLS